MPNQNNFRTDLSTKTEPRFLASRIINVPDDLILNEEVPASFAFDKDDNIEIHFYTVNTNQQILSTLINPNDAIIKSHIVTYNDGTYKNYIRIDFTKLFVDKNLILIPGDYRVVFNFFSNEIGSYVDRRLKVDVISNSRTEVQVSFNNTVDDIIATENTYLLNEFVEKGFNKPDAVGVAEKIFVSGVQLEDPTEGLTAQTIEEYIEVPEAAQTREDTVDRIEQINLIEIFYQQLETFLPELYKFLKEEIIINGDDRIQESEFRELLESTVRGQISRFANIVDKRIKVS